MSDDDDPPDPGRWRRLQEIFAEARETPPDQREPLLAARCGDDAGLLADVRSLLAADASQGALDALAQRLPSVVDVLDDSLPDRIGPYTIDGEVGRGGMGIVCRGYDPRLRRNVAIKLVAGELTAETAARQRFINEARAASALDHPNICTIYDIGTLPDGRIYLAMAYYGRGTLADRLKAGPLPIDEAIDIACQLSDALDCAHQAGIVHRDVKPRNVAFGERGEARLLDFGVALLGHDLDATGPTAGTPGYMAPEQVRGGRVDRRADVWGLGVVLFEMLCGRRPFTGEHAEVLRAITEDDAPRVTDLRPDIPPAVAAVVERALRRDAAERLATASDFNAALRAALAGTVAGTPRVVRWRRAAVLAVLIAATGATAFYAERRISRETGGISAQSDGPDYYVRGRDRYHQSWDELEAAITLLRSAVEHDPQHAPSHAFLARAYARATLPDNSRQGQLEWVDSAETHARHAHELAPHLPDGHSALGSVARARGQRELALEHHERARAIDPDYAYSVAEAGEIYQELRQVDVSIRLRERALALDPSLDEVRNELAVTYRVWDLPDEAMRHIRAGLQLKPDNAGLLWEAAQLELVFGDTTRARAYFNEYLPLLPPFERDRMSGWYEYINGDLHAALAHVERVAAAGSTSFDLRMYGAVYAGVGDTARGRPLLRRAIELVRAVDEAPGALPHRLHFTLGHLFSALDQRADALHWLSSWEAAGGFRSWRTLDREPSWGPLRDDPEFMKIVTRTDSVFHQRRQQILMTLASLHETGSEPGRTGQPRR